MAKAIKAASSGKKLGAKLQSRMASGHALSGMLSAAETDVETEIYWSETDIDGTNQPMDRSGVRLHDLPRRFPLTLSSF